jgi:hypothetical protein
MDHRLHHLRGGDHHPVGGTGTANDVLLHPGYFGKTDFHAKVAARDHHDVAGLGDFPDSLDSLRALDLCDDQRLTACLVEQPARLDNVLGGPRKRYREKIEILRCGDADVFTGPCRSAPRRKVRRRGG